MTQPQVIAYAPPSIPRTVIAWLTTYFGAGNVGMRRPQSAQLPYRMVTTVGGTETVERIQRCGTVSVHTFADSMDNAEYQAELTHQRMLLLGPPNSAPQTVTVTLPGNTTQTVSPDSITTSQIPTWADYEDDLIFRFVARYQIHTRFVVNPAIDV